MRLLQIAKHFSPDPGGIETVTESLADALPRHGVDSDVLCMGLRGHLYAAVGKSYNVIRKVPELQLGNKTLSLGYVRAVAALQGSYDAALLHVPNPLGVAAVLAVWRKPLFILWHADIPQPRLRRLLAPLDRTAVAQAQRVIVPTPIHATGSHLASIIVPKSAVAPYPFDVGRLAMASVGSPGLARIDSFLRGRRVVLGVGRLVPYKGFDQIVSAASALPADAAVVIVGTGGQLDSLSKQIASVGVADRVLLAGSLDDGDLAAMFKRAAVLCLPSISAAEMYGIVQVEALANAVPIVSTAIPRSGVDWVNRHEVSGLVVPVSDHRALAKALTAILEDPALRARLSDGASRLFREHHNLDGAAARYADIVRSLTIKN